MHSKHWASMGLSLLKGVSAIFSSVQEPATEHQRCVRAAVFTKPYSLTPVLPDSGQSGLPVNKRHTRKGYSGNGILKPSRGYFSLIRYVISPGVAEQPESVCIQRMRPERGRAAVLLWGGGGVLSTKLSAPVSRSKIILSSEADAF